MVFDAGSIAIYLVGLFLLYLCCWIFLKPLKWILRFGITWLLGGVGIWILNAIGVAFGWHLALNPFTAMIGGVLGIPGLIVAWALAMLL